VSEAAEKPNNQNTTMRTTVAALGAVALGTLFPLAAQVTETREKTKVEEHSDGTTTEKKTTTTTTTFTPEVKTKVVKYFEPHKTARFGLPPAWVTKVKVKEMPAAWRTTTIAPGVVITEKERPYLVEAPPDLISVLPPPTPDVRYYMAGGNVVAVDKSYKVVESINIPSIKITVDD
jgi:archaellum component FlaD/FlaE